MKPLNTEKSFLAPNKWVLGIILFLVFGLGLGIRLYDLFDAPLDFHPTRQMHSVLIARGMYYQGLADVPAWQQELALQQWKAEPHPEPQFFERMVAITYRVIGSEQLWIARLFSILFWMAGGAGLFLLGRNLIGQDGALIALIFYLFLPYGGIASRSFQPDPLMVCAQVFSYWAMMRWHRKNTWRNAILAGVLGGFSIYIKAVSVFFIGGAWLGLLLSGKSLREILRSAQVWVMGVLTILPAFAFFIYGTFIDGFMRSEFGMRFFPQLWKNPVFFLQWNSELSSVVGFAWFLMALLGSLLLKERSKRGLMLGLWGGYFAYGMALAYHISTHDYYQLPMIPIAALGLGAGAQLLFKNLKGKRFVQVALVTGILLFFIVLKSWDVRNALKRVNYDNEVIFWQTFGEKLGQDASIVGLLQDSGARLAYWGWVDTSDWLTSGDFNVRELAGRRIDMQSEFDRAIKGKDYFVITIKQELARQPELVSLLSQYTLLEETNDYIIYDLKQKTSSPP